MQAVNAQPVLELGRRSLVSFWQKIISTVFFPAEQESSNGDHKKENKQESSSCTMNFSKEAKNTSLFFLLEFSIKKKPVCDKQGAHIFLQAKDSKSALHHTRIPKSRL